VKETQRNIFLHVHYDFHPHYLYHNISYYQRQQQVGNGTLLKHRLIHRVIQLLKSPNSRPVFKIYLARTLWNLCENEENAKELYHKNGVEIVEGGEVQGGPDQHRIIAAEPKFIKISQNDLVDILHGDMEWHYFKFKVPYLSLLYSCGLVGFSRGPPSQPAKYISDEYECKCLIRRRYES